MSVFSHGHRLRDLECDVAVLQRAHDNTRSKVDNRVMSRYDVQQLIRETVKQIEIETKGAEAQHLTLKMLDEKDRADGLRAEYV